VLPATVWYTHFPAGGGGKRRGAILKGAGLKAGVPDILIIYRGMAYWIELKAPKGVISKVQDNTIAALFYVGSKVYLARNIDDVANALTQWGIPARRNRVS
jgi:hypothetical protein